MHRWFNTEEVLTVDILIVIVWVYIVGDLISIRGKTKLQYISEEIY